MPHLVSHNLATAITKLVATDSLPSLLSNLVIGNLVTRNFEPVVATVGDVVKIPTSWVDHEVPLTTHAEASFQIPDVTKVLAVPDLLRLYMEPAVIALAEKIESDLLNLFTGFTGILPGGVPGQPLTEAAIDSAETALFNAKVPVGVPKYLVVDGTAYSHLRRIPRFSEYSSADEAGLRNLIDGRIGKLKDFFVFRSYEVAKTSATSPPTTNNLAFTKDAIGFAMRRLPPPPLGSQVIAEYAELGSFGMRVILHHNPESFAQILTLDLLYGCSVIRPKHGVVVWS